MKNSSVSAAPSLRRARYQLALAGCLALLSSGMLLAAPVNELLFRALEDELQRNTTQLKMEGLDAPYFISYTIDDYQQLEISATLGTLLSNQIDRGRYLTIDLRVGDYSLDNSNFVTGFRGFGPSFATLPVDDDYDALRSKIYLETDKVYKDAVETLSKKRAYLQSRVVKDRVDDHIKLPANKFVGKAEDFDINRALFEDLALATTTVFRDYPQIVSSELKITTSIVNQYFISSTGSRTMRGDRIYGFELSLAGRTNEGENVSNADRIIVRDPKLIPSKTNLVSWARENARRMDAIIAGDTVEDYIGPVVFTGDAAGEFFRQLVARHVSNLPRPTYESDRVGGGADGSAFENKLNRRILPPTFNIYNDPTLAKIEDRELLGHYQVDDAGAAPQRVQLVEDGKLVTFLVGIAPTKKVREPNGSARGAVGKGVTAKPSNLIVESSEKATYEELKKALLDMCRDVDLEYGVIVKRLRDLNASSSPFSRIGFFAQATGGEEALTEPLEAYKVYPDGSEVPLRGLKFNNVNVRVLRDIAMAARDRNVYTYLIGDDYELPAAVVAPSFLIEEMELKRIDSKISKPPILPSPLAER